MVVNNNLEDGCSIGLEYQYYLQVGTADALAFFLPGVVSQFSKVLRTSKTSLSGAAGNTEATNQAIRGLAEYLMIVLADDANKSSVVMFMDFQSEIIMEKGKKAQYILEELRQLADKVRGGSIKVEESSSAEVAKKTTYESGSKEKMGADYLKGNKSFHVDRTEEWVAGTSTHVDKLLSATFPYVSPRILCVKSSNTCQKSFIAFITADVFAELISLGAC